MESDEGSGGGGAGIEWTGEHNIRLIAAVRDRPYIYRTSGFDEGADRASRSNAWREICSQVFSDWEDAQGEELFRVQVVRRKWRSLRDSYARCKRARAFGQGGRKYRYYNALRFLNENDKHDQQQTQQDSSAEELPEDGQPPPMRAPRRRKKPRVDKREEEDDYQEQQQEIYLEQESTNYEELELESPSHNKVNPPELDKSDAEQLFLASYASDLRRLSAGTRLWARAQISRVMQHAAAHEAAAPVHPDLQLDPLPPTS